MSSDECGNDAFCEKNQGICLCKKGFKGKAPVCIGMKFTSQKCINSKFRY